MLSSSALRNAMSSRTLACSWYSCVSRSPIMGSSVLTAPVTTSIGHHPTNRDEGIGTASEIKNGNGT
jgi:hypothetical protein